MTHNTEQPTLDTEGRSAVDTCAYVHERVGIRCGGDRAHHGLRYMDHDFKQFADAPVTIAKHPYEPLPSDSVTCRVCGQRPSHEAHTNVPLDAEGEWRYVETTYGAEVDTRPIRLRAHWDGLLESEDVRDLMRQIVADHKAAKSQALLVEALLAAKKHIGRKPQSPSLMPKIDAALKAAGVEEK
jgi:hypothetical protein